MSPADIKICLHYHACCDDYPGILQMTGIPVNLIAQGLLARSSDNHTRYVTTPRNDAFCKMLTAVPLPVQRWVPPQ